MTMIVANYAFVWEVKRNWNQNHKPKPICLEQTAIGNFRV